MFAEKNKSNFNVILSEDETVSQFIDYLKQGLPLQHEDVKRWLGEYRSDLKAFEDIENERHDFTFEQLSELATRSALMHSPYCHFLFSSTEKAALLFVNGESHEVSETFARSLCQEIQVDFQQLLQMMTANDKEVLLDLFNNGAIITCDDESS